MFLNNMILDLNIYDALMQNFKNLLHKFCAAQDGTNRFKLFRDIMNLNNLNNLKGENENF